MFRGIGDIRGIGVPRECRGCQGELGVSGFHWGLAGSVVLRGQQG